jgi:ribulose-5-phosphate 4-epimerase/fuculose-1-phosphate aldolase
MEQLLDKYAQKLIRAGLGAPAGTSRPLIGGMDDQLIWNREAPEIPVLTDVFKGLNINSLVFLRPAEPYASLIRHLAEDALLSKKLIAPKDCETRTFLHDLPVIDDFFAPPMVQALKKRKSVIILPGRTSGIFDGPAIVAPGTVSPEQGFVTTSSVCFACFVKFFTDYLEDLKTGNAQGRDHALFDRIIPYLAPLKQTLPDLMQFPFQTEETVYAAVIEAGQNTIAYELVDSYFGNVSYCWRNTLYISQTGSSLDELAGCIDPVPMDGSSSAGITASSELSAHMETISRTGCRAILHGHPKFCVILSMDCDPGKRAVCRFKDQCHTRCPEKRFVRDIPIVPGEVGTGATGLCHTLPRALARKGQAIVYGHGVFTTGQQDFSDAFAALLAVENLCRNLYFETVARLRNPI